MVLWQVIFSECWSITWAMSWCQREFCSSQRVHNMKKCMRFWIFMDSLKIQGFTETLISKIFWDFLIFLYNVTLLGKLSMNYVVFFIVFSWTTVYGVIFTLVYFHEVFKNWMSTFKFSRTHAFLPIAIIFLQHFTNLISRIQNNSWNLWKFSGMKKPVYGIHISDA